MTVEEAFLHCAKALIRARLWDPAAQVERCRYPTWPLSTRSRRSTGIQPPPMNSPSRSNVLRLQYVADGRRVEVPSRAV